MTNEEKILMALEMLAEKVDKLEQGQLEMRSDIKSLKQDSKAAKIYMSLTNESLEVVKASTLRTEHEYYPKVQASLDGIVAGMEHDEAQDKRIRRLENKVEQHDVEIFGLKQSAG